MQENRQEKEEGRGLNQEERGAPHLEVWATWPLDGRRNVSSYNQNKDTPGAKKGRSKVVTREGYTDRSFERGNRRQISSLKTGGAMSSAELTNPGEGARTAVYKGNKKILVVESKAMRGDYQKDGWLRSGCWWRDGEKQLRLIKLFGSGPRRPGRNEGSNER